MEFYFSIKYFLLYFGNRKQTCENTHVSKPLYEYFEIREYSTARKIPLCFIIHENAVYKVAC